MKIALNNSKGFSLVELLAVITIVAILAAIAYPNYLKYVINSNRSDAYSTLINVQLDLEEYYNENNQYPTSLTGFTTTSPKGFYTLSISTSGTPPNAYTLTATAGGSTIQNEDTGCTAISITNAGARTPADCW